MSLYMALLTQFFNIPQISATKLDLHIPDNLWIQVIELLPRCLLKLLGQLRDHHNVLRIQPLLIGLRFVEIRVGF